MNSSNGEIQLQQPGFRLHRVEVLNWGTFDRNIWSLNIAGENSLLTGDIGTGKSTLVDAITTLMVSAGRIVYNKAAGAEGKERSLFDYILGHYKKEKDSEDLQARAVSLRSRDTALTILLGHFHDSDLSECVCLAQFFWLKEGKSQPERFFLISSSPITIEKELHNPGSDVLALKKKLKAMPDIEIFDTFTSYSAEFRRRMGIQSTQAMELFYQTVSMKSIGNLTDFVRNHMLEETSVAERIETLCRNFDNLNQSHEAVLRARDQIKMLTPLIEECDEYDITEKVIHEHRKARESLYCYMASIEKDLLLVRIERLENEIKRITGKIKKNKSDSEVLESAREQISRDIDDNGGRRLGELEKIVNELQEELKRKKDRKNFYENLAAQIDLTIPSDNTSFYSNVSKVKEKITDAEKKQAVKKDEETELHISMREKDEESKSLDKELQSLRNRPTNIPYRNLDMRKNLCNALGLDEESIPFVGELIAVRDDESNWEGALERLLHTFGLSLLVEEQNYSAVSEYVNRTNLRGRLVYYRVNDQQKHRTIQVEPGHVIEKLRIKAETLQYRWLENEIKKRFDFICCETLDDFRHQPRAITAAGQIKSGGIRHEKDDRYRIDDRSRYILGWKNEQKIGLLKGELEKIRLNGDNILKDLERIGNELKSIRNYRDAARDLNAIQDYREIDWHSIALRIEESTEEIKEIEQSADILHTLKEQLNRVAEELKGKRKVNDELQGQLGNKESKREGASDKLENIEEVIVSIGPEQKQETFPLIDKVKNDILKNKKITLEGIDERQKELREKIQKSIDNATDKNRKRDFRISSQMQAYKDRFPVETSEIDSEIDAAYEYRSILDELITQDLPRHEERFKRLLREGTIQDIALFQNQLERERLEIKGKIDTINTSLREIEYSRGSYITLLPDFTLDAEIRDFQQDLKSCMGETLGNDVDDVYTESKFRQVKELIDRFQGRPGLIDLDNKWKLKVTNVRNWFIFSASERWIEDDSEKEFYSDSSGKSGGQKEKLAYTILAAALAYQFSLVNDGLWRRSFRFVMIDEAFGRGSDDSARYGLELFKKLQLQLLIVTPLQKIHVIEDFVKTVHFVYQEDNRSLVGHMSIEKYKEEQEKQGASAQ